MIANRRPRKRVVSMSWPRVGAFVRLLGEVASKVQPETLNAVIAEVRKTQNRYTPCHSRTPCTASSVAEDRTVPPTRMAIHRWHVALGLPRLIRAMR